MCVCAAIVNWDPARGGLWVRGGERQCSSINANEYEICNQLPGLVSETVVRSNYLFLYTKHRHTDLFFYFSLILLVDLMTIY